MLGGRGHTADSPPCGHQNDQDAQTRAVGGFRNTFPSARFSSQTGPDWKICVLPETSRMRSDDLPNAPTSLVFRSHTGR